MEIDKVRTTVLGSTDTTTVESGYAEYKGTRCLGFLRELLRSCTVSAAL